MIMHTSMTMGIRMVTITVMIMNTDIFTGASGISVR